MDGEAGVMSMQQSSSEACEVAAPDDGEITLDGWLAEGRRVDTRTALQLITRFANALCDAHLQGVRHGTLGPAAVILSDWSDASCGTARLSTFAPSTGAW